MPRPSPESGIIKKGAIIYSPSNSESEREGGRENKPFFLIILLQPTAPSISL